MPLLGMAPCTALGGKSAPGWGGSPPPAARSPPQPMSTLIPLSTAVECREVLRGADDTTKQGSVALLNDPVAQQLLQSTIPARLAYTWPDGTPRVVPIGFHWNGEEIVLGTQPDAPKMRVLGDGSKVALTIDSDRMPHKVLLIRGSVRIDVVDGIAPEYAAMCRRVMGKSKGRRGSPRQPPSCRKWRASSSGPSGGGDGLRDPLPQRAGAGDGLAGAG